MRSVAPRFPKKGERWSPKRIETTVGGVYPYGNRSRRPQTAKLPSPATAYRSAGSVAPKNGCRGMGFPVEIFSGGDPIFAQIPRTACATILLRGPRTESTVLSTNLWIIPCKSAPHRRNFYAQSSHHRSGPNPPAAPLPYPLERRPVRAQRRRFAADRPG